MELTLEMTDKNPQVAFCELLARCRGLPKGGRVAVFMVASAIQEIPRAVVRSPVTFDRGFDGAVEVGDFIFLVTPTRPAPVDAARCECMVWFGRHVVWLVRQPDEGRARAQLRRSKLLRYVEVRSISSYLALRTLFTSLDRGESMEDAARRIVERFNAYAAGASGALLPRIRVV